MYTPTVLGSNLGSLVPFLSVSHLSRSVSSGLPPRSPASSPGFAPPSFPPLPRKEGGQPTTTLFDGHTLGLRAGEERPKSSALLFPSFPRLRPKLLHLPRPPLGDQVIDHCVHCHNMQPDLNIDPRVLGERFDEIWKSVNTVKDDMAEASGVKSSQGMVLILYWVY